MGIKVKETEEIKPVSYNELPPEFKRFDKPFGLDQYVLNFILSGIMAHTGAFYFIFYLIPFGHVTLWTIPVSFVYGYMSGLGITVGAHRYWTHRTFKAKKPLQYILMCMQTAALQYPIFKWCRDHRVHHKYTDSEADPHSAARGFWFSHITWLWTPKHPEVEEKLKIVDISDLARDPVVRFQSKYYWELVLVIFFIFPMALFHFLFPEMSLLELHCVNMTRYAASLHFTFLVNSVAHLWGDKPYDKYITSTENKLVSLLAVGEGWHNYHHTFPWDYKAAELGFKINLSTILIHCFAWIGLAYDMKTVSHKLLVERINRTGDGSHPLHDHNKKWSTKGTLDMSPNTCWGWGDDQLTKEDIEITETVFPSKSRRG